MGGEVEHGAIPSGFTQSDAREVDSADRRFFELVEVGSVEDPAPGTRFADPAGHGSGVELAPRVGLVEPESECEFTEFPIPCRLERLVEVFPEP